MAKTHTNKFDLDTAWKDATRLFKDNFGLMAVIAGVFVFLPSAIVTLALPEMSQFGQIDNEEAAQAAMMAFFSENWLTLLLLVIVQTIGILALLALLRRHARPTVGEAIGAGFTSVPSYLAVQFIFFVGVVLLAAILVGFAATIGGAPLAAVGTIIFAVIAFYLAIKLLLAPVVIAMEDVRNPIAAMNASWQLTKGNSLRLFFFMAMIIVVYYIVAWLVNSIFSLIFALGGPEVQLFGTAIVSSAVSALFVMLLVSILAAIYVQINRLKGVGARNAAPVDRPADY